MKDGAYRRMCLPITLTSGGRIRWASGPSPTGTRCTGACYPRSLTVPPPRPRTARCRPASPSSAPGGHGGSHPPPPPAQGPAGAPLPGAARRQHLSQYTRHAQRHVPVVADETQRRHHLRVVQGHDVRRLPGDHSERGQQQRLPGRLIPLQETIQQRGRLVPDPLGRDRDARQRRPG